MKKNMFICKSVLAGTSGALLLLAGIFIVYPLRSQAATDAVLQFDQTNIAANIGDTVTLTARINPGTNEVGAVELDVTFNPSVLRLDSITSSDSFNMLLGGPTIDNSGTGNTDGNGSIDVGLLTNPVTYVTETSDAATFIFTVLSSATNSPVGIANTSNASAHGEYVVSTRTGAIITVAGESIEEDLVAPVLSSGSPSGILSAGTTVTTVGVATNENATCKYSTNSGTTYASMDSSFTTTGATSHSFSATGLVYGSSYQYYVRCQDSSNNANPGDYLISFSVANQSASISENKSNSSQNKKSDSKDEDKRSISNSKKKVARGEVLIERGKSFSKNSMVALYFSKYGGGYYPPVMVKTSSKGSFRIDYRVPANKPKGTYNWYAINLKTGWVSKVIYYRVR